MFCSKAPTVPVWILVPSGRETEGRCESLETKDWLIEARSSPPPLSMLCLVVAALVLFVDVVGVLVVGGVEAIARVRWCWKGMTGDVNLC